MITLLSIFENYASPAIVEALTQAPANPLPEVVSRFNQFLAELNFPVPSDPSPIAKISSLDLSNGKRISPEKYANELLKSYDSLLSNYRLTGNFFSPALVMNYLNTFFQLSRSCVFDPFNYNLYTKSFRQSRFLNSLISFSAKKEKNCLIFSLYDPFALDILSRGLISASLLERDNSASLFELRRSLLNTHIENAFRRYFTLDGITYLLKLDRRSSQLIARPRKNLSSVEEINPIYLLEKTVAYIENNIKNRDNSFSLNICLVGCAAENLSELEASLMDYLNAILYWYSVEFNYPNKPRLILCVKAIVSKSALDSSFTLKTEKDGCLAYCLVEPSNYEKDFTFNTLKLEKEIKENNLIFLLDCPWLSIESLVNETSSLGTYCELLKSTQNLDTVDRFNDCRDPTLPFGFYAYSKMRRLGENYNRIMCCLEDNKAGSIIYIVKDSLAKRLISFVENSKGAPKELYLFLPESATEYSLLSCFPTVKREVYDGRPFLVSRFKNSPSECLNLSDSKNSSLSFSFSLWEVLKPVAPSYVYLYLKERLLNCLGINEVSKSPVLILFLYKNIFIDFSVKEKCQKIKISVSFSDNFDNLLAKIVKTPDFAQIKAALFKLVEELIKPLYKNYVFNSIGDNYGSNTFRQAFIQNLYDSATSVDDLFFLQKYYAARTSKTLNVFFRLTFSEQPASREKSTIKKPSDSFADKRLYSSLLATFDRQSETTMGFTRMILEADTPARFKKPANISIEKHIASNIVSVCKRYDEKDSFLCKNALRMFETSS